MVNFTGLALLWGFNWSIFIWDPKVLASVQEVLI